MNAVAHIGRSIQIKGDVSAKEPLTIAGHVTGTIDLSGQTLTVTEEAHIDADVMAHTIIVAGTVSGRLIADGRIVVQQTAVLTGDVEAPALSVHDGAVVQGRLDISGHRQLVALKPAV